MLTDEEKSIRDTVRDFVSEEVIPVIEKIQSGHMKFPAQLVLKWLNSEYSDRRFQSNTEEWGLTM